MVSRCCTWTYHIFICGIDIAISNFWNFPAPLGPLTDVGVGKAEARERSAAGGHFVTSSNGWDTP